jgi:Pvc16 N-terminal domain
MASYPAIAAMSDAVLGLLRTAAIGGEFADVEFAHYGSANFQTPMSLGLSLYLYRVSVSANRNVPWRTGVDGRRYRPPIPLDAHFLVTAWSEDPIRQQRMLGFAIRTLEDTPILPAGVLNQHAPETDVFRPEETVELVFENVSVQDASYVWEVAQTKEQPSATYVARMIEIESGATDMDFAAPVQTREFDVGAVTRA